MPNSSSKSLLTFDSLSSKYLNYIQFERPRPVSAMTLRSHRIRLRIMGRSFGWKAISQITKDDVNVLRTDMIKRKCKLKYISVFLSVLRAMLGYCRDELHLKKVLDPKEIKLPPSQPHEVKFVSPDELRLFVNAIDKQSYHGIRMMAVTSTLLDTGMRISELVSLNRKPFDQGMTDIVITGKGNKERVVFFRAWSMYWIKMYLSLRTDSSEALFVCNAPNYPAERITDDGLRCFFRSYSKKLQIKGVSPHKLRRTGATYLRANGADTHDIQKWLGHSKIGITELYIGTNWEAVRSSINRFQSYGNLETLNGGPKPEILWSKKWDQCIGCRSKERPHLAKGYCDRCYVDQWRKRKTMFSSTAINFTLTSKVKSETMEGYEKTNTETKGSEKECPSFFHKTEGIL